jgi:predicted lipid-binding transport protein (Tim44 family)
MGLIGFLSWLLNSNLNADTRRIFGAPVPNEMNLEASLSGGVSELPPDAVMSATPRPMSEIAHDQIAQLQRIDPDFNEVAFLSQATNAFQAALQAEGAMNPDAVSSIGTSAFVDCLKQKVADWRNSGLTRTIGGLKLDPPTLMKISVDGTQQQMAVRFTGTAVRNTTDSMTNTLSDGSAQPQWFTEFATFVRPAGSTTPKAAAAGAPVNCPKCGAPAPPGALVCPYCSSPLSGTGGTWLLDHLSASAYT